MKFYPMADPFRFPRMSTEELRATFLVQELFQPGQLQTVYINLDRAVVGSAVPLDTALTLPAEPELRAACFTERRELGILNIGAPGSVEVERTSYKLGHLDGLYVGSGNPSVIFRSESSENPAEFYLLSFPSHAIYPTALIAAVDQTPIELGITETCNRRHLTKLIHAEGVKSSQLVMGFTEVASGSAWNTMPPHTHMRRSEIYLYFDLPANNRVVHLMGPPEETRHLLVANKQVILSPGWSIHAGVGTRNYSFCWGMGGENQAFDDMDPIAISELQ